MENQTLGRRDSFEDWRPKLALIICHDGMFPEMALARMRLQGRRDHDPHRWLHSADPLKLALRQSGHSFQNLMITANVCMCGSDGSFDPMGEGMIINFDGTVIAHGTTGRVDEIITAEVRPDLVREARINWGGVENNIYQLWHRGYEAVKGGAMDCP